MPVPRNAVPPASVAVSMPPPTVGASELSRAETKIANPAYREVLEDHRIRLDPIGIRNPGAIQEFVEQTIFQDRGSPLSEKELDEVQRTADKMYNHSESKVTGIISTPMFRLSRDGMEDDANTQWTTEPLPNSSGARRMVAPKADVHFGYSYTSFTMNEKAVCKHARVLPYAKPTPYNVLPFLIFEIKSEAPGGTLWLAENQAAGAGCHSVCSVRFLLEEAEKQSTEPRDIGITDAICFSATINARQVGLWIHYYEDGMYMMSCIGNYFYSDRASINKFRNALDNIVDHCMGTRLDLIKETFNKLFPVPTEWSFRRSSSDVSGSQPGGDASPITEYTAPEQSQPKRVRG